MDDESAARGLPDAKNPNTVKNAGTLRFSRSTCREMHTTAEPPPPPAHQNNCVTLTLIPTLYSRNECPGGHQATQCNPTRHIPSSSITSNDLPPKVHFSRITRFGPLNKGKPTHIPAAPEDPLLFAYGTPLSSTPLLCCSNHAISPLEHVTHRQTLRHGHEAGNPAYCVLV